MPKNSHADAKDDASEEGSDSTSRYHHDENAREGDAGPGRSSSKDACEWKAETKEARLAR